jgi:predicted nucleotidyltransferase
VRPFRQPILDLINAEYAAWEALVERIRSQLAKHDQVQAGWLYGSVARGDDTPASDIDMNYPTQVATRLDGVSQVNDPASDSSCRTRALSEFRTTPNSILHVLMQRLSVLDGRMLRTRACVHPDPSS